MGLHQAKKLLHSKETVSRIKKLPTEWEKIFASNSSNKGLISKIYKDLKNLNPQRISIPIKKWAHELNREFSKGEAQIANKYQKKYSTSLVTKEMHIKTRLRFHLTPVRMAIFKRKKQQQMWERMLQNGIPYTLLVAMQISKIIMKKLKIELPYDPVIPFLNICLKDISQDTIETLAH
jgi:hypothetical protein